MQNLVHIYLSFDPADAACAADFKRQLALAVQPSTAVFWDPAPVPVEAFRTEAEAFMERCNLFVAMISQHYEDKPDVRWEASRAVGLQPNRPALQIMTLLVRKAAVPRYLGAFASALPPGETVEHSGLPREHQLYRAAVTAAHILEAAPAANEIGIGLIELPIGIEDLRERLLAQTDRINHAPLLALLKRLIRDVNVKRGVLDVEEQFKQLREKTRLSQISIDALKEQAAPIQQDLFNLIERLNEADLTPQWRQIFIRDYYRFTADSRDDSTAPPFFIPVDEINIPETLNLPVGPSEQESLEQIGLLSFEQKNDFRRNLLLAKDALAVKNPAQAYQYCDHVRNRIDPQSAQLYEFLLITYLQKEGALRIMQDAVEGNDRHLQHILLFASRLRDYQRDGKCPSSTAWHNLEIAAEGISDAALRLYHDFPNDPLRHTGKHAESVPDNRRPLRIILGNTLKVCRLVHPSEELLEAAVIECCGGGKCHWLEKVEVVGDDFQFLPNGHFDLLGEIHELMEMLQEMEAAHEHKIVKGQGLLREDLYYSLLAKRQALAQQIAEDKKRRRPYTDVRESVIRFTYACLLGAEIFGDADARGHGNSFYRLALEYLLPGLLLAPEPEGAARMRWFTLDHAGELAPHPDCAAYRFDVQGIVEKIVRDYAGRAGWLQVQPNIKDVVYREYIADTISQWEMVRQGLSYTDFRRMDAADARRLMVECLRRNKVACLAFPDRPTQDFIDNSIQELVGNGLLNWVYFDSKGQLSTLPESLAFGYDAQTELRSLLEQSTRFTEEDLRRAIASNIFDRQIKPHYEAIKTGDESRRAECAMLLAQCLFAYKLYQDVRFLEHVWQEITLEFKYRWIDVSYEGKEVAFKALRHFDVIAVAQELHTRFPQRFKLFGLREQVARRRMRDAQELYLQEVSEYKHENRLPERKVAIAVIRKLKGLFLYYPDADFLKLPMDELNGKGRIRWHAKFLDLLPTRENHFENDYFNFEYKFERYDIKRLLDNQYTEMQRVLQETGEL